MKFKHINKLNAFINEIDEALTKDSNKKEVKYSPEHISSWDVEKFDSDNKQLLDDITKNANLYMLHTCNKDEQEYKLRYIGKTKANLARQRLRNHLFKKNDNTGAKLELIQSHVQKGGSVKISWVTIEPESLRNWAEEALINKHTEADWNRENKKKRK